MRRFRPSPDQLAKAKDQWNRMFQADDFASPKPLTPRRNGGVYFCQESGLSICPPSRASGNPPQPKKLFPALLGGIAAQLFPPLEQGGLTVWHLPPVVDEHLWVADLCLRHGETGRPNPPGR